MILSYLLTCINIVFALIFFTSFYMKIVQFSNLKYVILSYELVKNNFLVHMGSIVVVGIELLLVLSYMIQADLVVREVFVIMLLLFFNIILYKKQLHSKDKTSCNCFGNVSFLNKNPITRNSIFIILILMKILVAMKWEYADFNQSLLIIWACALVVVIDIVTKIKIIRGTI